MAHLLHRYESRNRGFTHFSREPFSTSTVPSIDSSPCSENCFRALKAAYKWKQTESFTDFHKMNRWLWKKAKIQRPSFPSVLLHALKQNYIWRFALLWSISILGAHKCMYVHVPVQACAPVPRATSALIIVRGQGKELNGMPSLVHNFARLWSSTCK